MSGYHQVEWIDEKLCAFCSSVLSAHVGAGRPSVYCSRSCQCKAFRHRGKTRRNSSSPKETRRNSSSPKETIPKPDVKKVIGVSGTVHKLPVSESVDFLQPPAIKSFSDFKAFFCE
jgi:hypothetical protein